MPDTLFAPQPYSLDVAPSANLAKRAEKFTNFDPSNFGGWVLRAAYRQENKAAHAALFAAAIPGLVVELPAVLAATAYEKRLEKKFVKAAIEEYPHIEGRWYYSWLGHQSVPALSDGTPHEYAQAVLEYPAPDAAVSAANTDHGH